MQLEKSQLTVTGFEYVGRGPQTKEYVSIQQIQITKTTTTKTTKPQFCKQQENRDLTPIKASSWMYAKHSDEQETDSSLQHPEINAASDTLNLLQ